MTSWVARRHHRDIAASNHHWKSGLRAVRSARQSRSLVAAIAKMAEPDRAMAKKVHALIKAADPALAPKALVRNACVCQRRQRHLLLPKRREVQSQISDARLQRQGAPRRPPYVDEFMRAHKVD